MKKILLILLLTTMSFAGTWEDITDISKPITLHNIFERPMNFAGILIKTNDYCDLGKYLKRSTINNYATVLLNDINANKFTYTNTGTLPVMDYGNTNITSGGSTDLTTVSNQFVLKNNVIDMGANKIINLADGVDSKDAVTVHQLKTDTGTRSTEPTATSYTIAYNDSKNNYIVDWTNGFASDTTYILPEGTNISLYSDFTFVNLTTNLLIVQANANDYIMDSGKGKTIYSGVALSNINQYASITLKLVRSNQWMATSMFGTWTTTE